MLLPIKSYFDPEVFLHEKSAIFSQSPVFVGMESMVPSPNSFQVLERFQNTKVLVRDQNEIRLLSNICRHRQSNIVIGSGQTSQLRCPLHHWSYNLDGTLRNAPYFEKSECADLRLAESPLQSWNGLLFSGARAVATDLADLPTEILQVMELDRFRYSRTVTEKVAFNWKHYIDGFAEDYHVPFVHPGFNQFIDLQSVQWIRGAHFSGETFRLRPREWLETQPSTPNYSRWVSLLLQQYPEQLPALGGVLLLVYPNCMIEWYPKFLIVTTLFPVHVGETLVHVDFYHDATVLERFPDLVTAAEATYDETGGEDLRMCRQLAAGREGLYRVGQCESGPTHPVYEQGLAAFHNYYLNVIRL